MKIFERFKNRVKKTEAKESDANKLSKYNENLQLQLIGLRIGLGMTQEEFAELTGARLVIKKREDRFTRFYNN